MMKNYIATLGIFMFLSACNPQADSKAIRNEVINIHDKLMIDGNKLNNNKINLQAVLKSKKHIFDDSLKIQTLVNKLNQADKSMTDWMHFFKEDYKGKNEQEDLEYYQSQMVNVRLVEDVYIKMIRTSDSLLKIYNIVPVRTLEH